MTPQRLRRFLPFVLGQRIPYRFFTSLMLLVLILMCLPALSSAQQTCQPDGDVNQNGSVTAVDALLAFQQALSLTQLDACQLSIADVFPSTTRTRRQHHGVRCLVHFPEGAWFAVLF